MNMGTKQITHHGETRLLVRICSRSHIWRDLCNRLYLLCKFEIKEYARSTSRCQIACFFLLSREKRMCLAVSDTGAGADSLIEDCFFFSLDAFIFWQRF